MFNKILLTLIAISSLTLINAQVNEEYYFGTFEDGTLEGFVNATVVNNPGANAINPSLKVIHYTGGAWWGPSRWKDQGHFTSYHTKLRVDVYLPQGALQPVDWSDDDLTMFILHARNCASGDIEHWQSATQLVYTEQNWITIEFNLGTLEHFCYRNLILASSSPIGFYSDNYRWVMNLPDYDEDVIFVEKFEGATFPPQGWTHFSTGNPSWERSSAQNYNPLGHYSAKHPQAGFDPVQSWLVTPAIQIPEEGDYEISFFSLNTSNDWYNPGLGKSNSVWVSATGNNPQEDDFQKVWEALSVQNSWEQSIISLHQYSGQEIYIAFVFQGNLISHSWFLDNITLYEGEPKAVVNMQPVEDCAANFITINLEMDNPMPTTALQFDFQLPQGFAYIEGSALLQRHTNHQVHANLIADSLLRIIAFSPDNSPFSGNSGIVLSFDVHAANQEGVFFLPFTRSIVSDLQGNDVLFTAYPAPLSLSPSTTIIIGHPSSQEASPGDNVSFQVEATGDNLSYQWYFNHEPVEGASMPILSISNISLDDNGEYYCMVSGDCGILRSNTATLIVIEVLFQVTFHVKEQEATPVGNAEIIIAQNDTIYTDNDGYAFVELPVGSYPYTVAKEGFQVFSGLFFITSSNITITISLLPLGVNEDFFSQTRVFPNPFAETLFIRNAPPAGRYVITDITGKTVLGGLITDVIIQSIDTSILEHGLYFLTLFANTGEKITFTILK